MNGPLAVPPGFIIRPVYLKGPRTGFEYPIGYCGVVLGGGNASELGGCERG